MILDLVNDGTAKKVFALAPCLLCSQTDHVSLPPFLPELGARVLERSKYFQKRVRVRAFRLDQTTIINETTTNANHTAF